MKNYLAGSRSMFAGLIASVATITTCFAAVPITAPSGMVSWWQGQVDGSDLLGLNNGSLQGSVAIVPGFVGNGFGFSGLGSVRIPHSPSLNFSSQLTIELWYNSTQPNSVYFGLVDKRGTGVGPANFGISNVGDVGIGPYYNDPSVIGGDDAPYGSFYEASRFTPAPSPNMFHHLAVTYEQLVNNQVRLQTYVDGQMVRSLDVIGNLANTLNGEAMHIGATAGTAEAFLGIIDEVTIYDRVLSGSEIQGIFGAGAMGKILVPEPGAAAFAMLGLGAFLLRRRSK
jgi:MYXO-CTERM domain-containing protein